MMKKNTLFIGLLLLAVMALGLSCSQERTTAPDSANASIHVVFPKGANTQLVDHVTLDVTGANDFLYQDTTEVVAGRFQFKQFQIPAGPALFNLKALYGLEEIYSALEEADIVAGQTNFIEVNFVSHENSGTVTGLVTDATNGMPISGAQVLIGDQNTLTNSMGEYTLSNVPIGESTISASRDGYITNDKMVTVTTGSQIVNFVLSPVASEGEWRFVLTWGSTPDDLDLHLWTQNVEIYWNNPGSPDTPPYAYLDIDDTDGYGPETITIQQLQGLCQIAVKNYLETPDIKLSNATVDVYHGALKVQTFSIPTTGVGTWWYVCDLQANGTLISRNYLTDTPPAVSDGGQEHPVK